MYRLIIADDQPIECRALEHKIKSEFPDIQILPSVYDGIQLLKSVEEHRPDIAIVDINMPGLDGLEAIEILKMKKIDIKVVIHTSYSEFEYARKALHLGAAEYLLKPSSAEEIADTLHKLCRALDKEKRVEKEIRKTQNEIHIQADFRAGKWLMSLFLHQADPESYREFLRNYPEALKGGVFSAWKPIENSKNADCLNWKETEELILKYMRQFCGCVGMRYKDIYYLFMFPDREPSGEYEEAILEITDAVCKKMTEIETPFAVGISKWKDNPDQYENGLYEARIAIQGQRDSGISFFQYGRTISRKMMLTDLEAEAIQKMLTDDPDGCVELVRERILSEHGKEGQDAQELLKVQTLEFILHLRHELGNLVEKPELGMEGRIFNSGYQELASVQEILKWAEQQLLCMYHGMKDDRQGSQYIVKTLLFMKEHFQEDLSLEEVGKQIGISSFYLSRLLKQERKTTFVEILTDIRLQTALDLMKEGHLPVKEICRQSGYPNMSYFYKVLKKMTGMTAGTLKRYL